MNLNERYRKCPIKFYKNPDGTIYYEAPFINGTAKNMDDAFKVFTEQDWEYDLLYYYNDVLDVKFGTFEPAIKDLKKKGRTYLGKINLELDINPDFKDEHTVQHLATNPQDIPKHQKFIKDLKDKRKRQEFLNNLKQGFKRLAGSIVPIKEMFDPIKTRNDLICSHCGEIIPKGSYYEEYQGQNYHLECIWDKLYGEKSKDYQDCREYFFSLQKYIGNWPVKLDIEDDYLIDLEFVKSNDRRLGLHEEAAAMKQSPHNTFDEFFEYCIKNPKLEQKLYFVSNNGTIRIPSDTINHAWKKHKTTCEQWKDAMSNLHNIQTAGLSKRKLQGWNTYLCRILGFKDFGISLMDCPQYFYVMTLFIDNPNTIDSWIMTESGARQTGKPSASLGENPNIRRVCPPDSNNIIRYITEKIKP